MSYTSADRVRWRAAEYSNRFPTDKADPRKLPTTGELADVAVQWPSNRTAAVRFRQVPNSLRFAYSVLRVLRTKRRRSQSPWSSRPGRLRSCGSHSAPYISGRRSAMRSMICFPGIRTMRLVRAATGSISARIMPCCVIVDTGHRRTDRAADSTLADKSESIFCPDSIHCGKIHAVFHGP